MKPSIECAYTELVPIHKMQPHPKNPHIHSPEQIDRLAKLIDYQGIRHPIIISKRSGFIVAGHGRLEALKKLNVADVPIDYQDFETEAQEYAFIVSDNAIGKDEWAALDIEAIKMEIGVVPINVELLGIFNLTQEIKEIENSGKELDLNNFDNFKHQCPKCGFEWDENENRIEDGAVESDGPGDDT